MGSAHAANALSVSGDVGRGVCCGGEMGCREVKRVLARASME